MLSWLLVRGLHLAARVAHSTNDPPNWTSCSLKTWRSLQQTRFSDVACRLREEVTSCPGQDASSLPLRDAAGVKHLFWRWSAGQKLLWQPGYAENFAPESSVLCLTGSSAQEIKSAEWLYFEKSCQEEWKRCDKILTLDLFVSFGPFYLHRSVFSRAPSGGWLQDSLKAPPTPC